jgi:hypothetical protein
MDDREICSNVAGARFERRKARWARVSIQHLVRERPICEQGQRHGVRTWAKVDSHLNKVGKTETCGEAEVMGFRCRARGQETDACCEFVGASSGPRFTDRDFIHGPTTRVVKNASAALVEGCIWGSIAEFCLELTEPVF